MPSLRPLYPAIRLAVACVVLAIGLRTWLVMGLIEPVTVAGSSMAPALRGAFVTAQCPNCPHSFSVGVEFAAGTDKVICPQCARNVPLSSQPGQHGDRLWIDRATLRWRAPKRWELVVARNPENAAELCVKRVVGLPGETVALRDGNVLIDGAIFVKSHDEQMRLRQIVHHEKASSRRWQPEEATAWQWNGKVWQHDAFEAHQQGEGDQQGEAIDWLRYHHPLARPLTDDVTYNAGLTRQLNLVNEFMLSMEISLRGTGTLALALDDGTATVEILLRFPVGELSLLESGLRSSTARLSQASRQRLALGKVRVELSNFDQQLLLTIDDQTELRRPWPNTKAAGTAQPVSVGARGLGVQLGGLVLSRDLYHCPQAVGIPPPQARRWQLGPAEYFLLGDNSPVSLDSRSWGPVRARLLVGKPFGGR